MADRKLSIIIPFAGEYPQAIFTIRAIGESLKAHPEIDFEVIAVDNWCPQIEQQAIDNMRLILRSSDLTNGLSPEVMLEIADKAWPKVTLKNKTGEAIEAVADHFPWLKYIKYQERLSHWQCKRVACEAADGDTFLFVDAHCIPSANGIPQMFNEYYKPASTPDGYEDFTYAEAGSMHLPLTYKIMEWRWSIYKMVVEGPYHYYKFTRFRPSPEPYEVPVMSTCGMMLSREIYEKIGGWPKGLGIYGGGENFMNYTLAATGHKKWIYPHGVLTHHGERRDYHYLGDDLVLNRAIAHFLFGGEGLMWEYLESTVKNNEDLKMVLGEGAMKVSNDQRQRIKAITTVDLKEWINGWQAA